MTQNGSVSLVNMPRAAASHHHPLLHAIKQFQNLASLERTGRGMRLHRAAERNVRVRAQKNEFVPGRLWLDEAVLEVDG